MRNKIIKAFLTIITALLITEAFLVIAYVLVNNKYQQITDNLVSEYQLTEKASGLVNSFYDLIQYSNDKKRIQAFRENLTVLRALLAKLDKNLSNSDSWVVYVGTKNTVSSVIEEVNKGLNDISAGNFLEVTNDYLRAADINSFIRENTSNLVLKELEGAEKTLADLATTKFWSEIVGLIIFVLAVFGSLLYTFFFANKLSEPVRRMAQFAQNLGTKNYAESLNDDLKTGNDELATLAKSLDSLALCLKNDAKKIKSKDEELVKTQQNIIEMGRQIDSLREPAPPKDIPSGLTNK